MSTLRTGLVGYGFIAERGHVPAYLSGKAPFHVTAVAEPCRARWPLIERLLPAAHIYPDHRAMLAREQLEVVDICTPPSAHAEIALAAFERGAHVLCKKPLAMDGRQARHMGRCGRARGSRALPRAQLPLRAGDARGPKRAGQRAHRKGASCNRRHVTADARRAAWTSGTPTGAAIRSSRGGGILMDHGPHTFYLAFDWLGGYPSEASAELANHGGGVVEDDVVTTLRFADGGLLRSHLTWNSSFRQGRLHDPR